MLLVNVLQQSLYKYISKRHFDKSHRPILTDLEGGRYFFNAVKEGDSIIYASDDENECHLWVMAMYRATGQSHKPTPPLTLQDKNSTISKIQGGKQNVKDRLS